MTLRSNEGHWFLPYKRDLRRQRRIFEQPGIPWFVKNNRVTDTAVITKPPSGWDGNNAIKKIDNAYDRVILFFSKSTEIGLMETTCLPCYLWHHYYRHYSFIRTNWKQLTPHCCWHHPSPPSWHHPMSPEASPFGKCFGAFILLVAVALLFHSGQ